MTQCHLCCVLYSMINKRCKKMPKETFMNLPDAKKNKIIRAAKKEFERVPYEQASIKNIVEDANIARGSFYQYFESKEDLLRVYFKYTF